jgi:hypothetical protein
MIEEHQIWIKDEYSMDKKDKATLNIKKRKYLVSVPKFFIHLSKKR